MKAKLIKKLKEETVIQNEHNLLLKKIWAKYHEEMKIFATRENKITQITKTIKTLGDDE